MAPQPRRNPVVADRRPSAATLTVPRVTFSQQSSKGQGPKAKVTWLLEPALGLLCSNTWQGPSCLVLVGDLPPLMGGGTCSQKAVFLYLKDLFYTPIPTPSPPPMCFHEGKEQEQMGFSSKVTTCLQHFPSPHCMPLGVAALWLPWQLCRGNVMLLEGQRGAIWVILR